MDYSAGYIRSLYECKDKPVEIWEKDGEDGKICKTAWRRVHEKGETARKERLVRMRNDEWHILTDYLGIPLPFPWVFQVQA